MNNINNAVMAETGLDQYTAQQRKELLTQIAGFAASSSSKSKSGGGYMGLVKKAGGGMMPIKFLTRYKERGAHYDRTIVENCLNEDNKVFFTASETLERILLDLAAKAGDAAKKEVQDMLSDWRTKSGCGGKTLLSRNVVFKAVKAINNELKDEDKADLAHLKTEGSWGDTSLSTIRQRLSGQMNKGDTDKLRKALKTAHAKSTKVVDAMAETKSTINGLKDAKFGGDLTAGERELLRKIRSAETLPKNDTKAGHGYMGLTISDGALVPLRFLTHYSERGAHTDRTIMANVADKGKVGELAFKSSKLLETVLLKLATRVGCGKDVSELFNAWKAKSQHNGQTLLSREVVHQVYAKINYTLFAQNKPAVTADSLPAKSDTRIEQLNSLDAEQDLQTLDDMLNGNKPVNNAGKKEEDIQEENKIVNENVIGEENFDSLEVGTYGLTKEDVATLKSQKLMPADIMALLKPGIPKNTLLEKAVRTASVYAAVQLRGLLPESKEFADKVNEIKAEIANGTHDGFVLGLFAASKSPADFDRLMGNLLSDDPKMMQGWGNLGKIVAVKGVGAELVEFYRDYCSSSSAEKGKNDWQSFAKMVSNDDFRILSGIGRRSDLTRKLKTGPGKFLLRLPEEDLRVLRESGFDYLNFLADNNGADSAFGLRLVNLIRQATSEGTALVADDKLKTALNGFWDKVSETKVLGLKKDEKLSKDERNVFRVIASCYPDVALQGAEKSIRIKREQAEKKIKETFEYVREKVGGLAKELGINTGKIFEYILLKSENAKSFATAIRSDTLEDLFGRAEGNVAKLKNAHDAFMTLSSVLIEKKLVSKPPNESLFLFSSDSRKSADAFIVNMFDPNAGQIYKERIDTRTKSFDTYDKLYNEAVKNYSKTQSRDDRAKLIAYSVVRYCIAQMEGKLMQSPDSQEALYGKVYDVCRRKGGLLDHFEDCARVLKNGKATVEEKIGKVRELTQWTAQTFAMDGWFAGADSRRLLGVGPEVAVGPDEIQNGLTYTLNGLLGFDKGLTDSIKQLARENPKLFFSTVLDTTDLCKGEDSFYVNGVGEAFRFYIRGLQSEILFDAVKTHYPRITDEDIGRLREYQLDPDQWNWHDYVSEHDENQFEKMVSMFAEAITRLRDAKKDQRDIVAADIKQGLEGIREGLVNRKTNFSDDPDISVFKIDVDTVGGTPLLNGYQSGLTNDELDLLVRLEKSGQFKDLFDLFKIPASVNGSPTSIVTIADKLDKCLGGGGRLGDLFSKYAAKLTPAEALELVMATLHGTAVMNIPEDVEPEGVTEELAKKLKKITCDRLLGLNENKVAPIKDMHDESKLVFNPVNKSADNNIVNIEDGENQNEVLDTPESKSLWRQYLSQNQSFERLAAADQKNVLTMLTLIDGSRKQLAGAGATFLNNQLYDAFMAAMIIDALPKARQLQESRGNSNGVISYEDWCEALGLHPEEGGANFEVVYDVQDSDENTKRIVEKLSPVNIAVALLNRSLTDLFGTPWLEVQSKAERIKYGEFLASFSAGGTYSENLEKFDTVAKSGMTHE